MDHCNCKNPKQKYGFFKVNGVYERHGRNKKNDENALRQKCIPQHKNLSSLISAKIPIKKK